MATHECPGGCNRQVKYEHFACRNCWYRLPKTYRDEIWRWYQKDSSQHMAAMVAAQTWYFDNS